MACGLFCMILLHYRLSKRNDNHFCIRLTIFCVSPSLYLPFSLLGSGPKGPMSCRTQGVISKRPSVCPSVRPSVRPPPRWPWRPKILTLRPDLGPLSPQISPPGLKSALWASNQLSRPQISSQGIKSALQASNPLSRPQISIPGPKSALQASNLPPRPKACPKTSNLIFRHKSSPRPQTPPQLPLRPAIFPLRTSGNSPCVLQDIGPLGPLLCSHSITSLDHSKQGMGYRCPSAILE